MGEKTQASGQGAAAGGSGRYRNWTAIQDLMPGPVRPHPLRVGGEYHLNQRCGGVSLRVAIPQGIVPGELLLDLVDGPGNGGDWVDVRGEFPATPRQYSSVRIADSDGESIMTEVETPV
jgi:hypothetical protein